MGHANCDTVHFGYKDHFGTDEFDPYKRLCPKCG